ncbi:MAG: hypothetical protein ACPGUI_07725, partial [Halarcobacter sp.]
MNCEYFGKCGSCTLYDKNYEEQLEYKVQREKQRFSQFDIPNIDIIKSEEQNFRTRAEFRIWKNFDNENNPTISYAMNDFDKNALEIESCQIVSKDIACLMPKLLEKIQNDEELKFKLFACEFLNSTTNDMLVTLIYHRKLEENWIKKAKELEKELDQLVWQVYGFTNQKNSSLVSRAGTETGSARPGHCGPDRSARGGGHPRD